MSRSGYSDDCENVNLWRANVYRTVKGKKGQAFLRELATRLDEMPEKRLIRDELVHDPSNQARDRSRIDRILTRYLVKYATSNA